MPASRHQMFNELLIPEETAASHSSLKTSSPYSPSYGNANFANQAFNQQQKASPGQRYRQQSRGSSGSIASYSSRKGNKTHVGSRIAHETFSSDNSTKKPSLFGRKKKQYAHDAFDEDGEDDYEGSYTDAGPEVAMSQLAGLRGDRYPVMADSPKSPTGSARSMSLRSMSNFDTAPIIPTLGRAAENKHSTNYRKNLAKAHKQGLHTFESDLTLPYIPSHFRPPSRQKLPQQMHSNGPQSSHNQQMPRHMIRIRSLTSLESPMGLDSDPLLPPAPLTSRSRSLRGNKPPMLNGTPGANVSPARKSLPNTPQMLRTPQQLRAAAFSPPPGSALKGPQSPLFVTVPRSNSKDSLPSPTIQSISSPNSQTTSNFSSPGYSPKGLRSGITGLGITIDRATSPLTIEPIASKREQVSTATSPIAFEEFPNSVKNAPMQDKSTQLVSTKSVEDSTNTAETTKLIESLRTRNVSLLDEIRLVTSELADSSNRKLDRPEITGFEQRTGTELNADHLIIDHRERVMLLMSLQTQLDVERRHRLIAEEKLYGLTNKTELLKPLYNTASLETELASAKREVETLQKKLTDIENQNRLLKHNSIHLEDNNQADFASNTETMGLSSDPEPPKEPLRDTNILLKSKNLKSTFEDKASNGTLNDKVKELEAQRDALREALRSLRERKDHEIHNSNERVRQLEAKLEKERTIKIQTQRKGIQGHRSASSNANSPTTLCGFPVGMSSPTGEFFKFGNPKRRQRIVSGNASENGVSLTANKSSISSVASDSTMSISLGASQSIPTSPASVSSPIQSPRSNIATVTGTRKGSVESLSSYADFQEKNSGPYNAHYYPSDIPVPRLVYAASTALKSSVTKGDYQTCTGRSLSLPNGRTERIPLSLGSGL